MWFYFLYLIKPIKKLLCQFECNFSNNPRLFELAFVNVCVGKVCVGYVILFYLAQSIMEVCQ